MNPWIEDLKKLLMAPDFIPFAVKEKMVSGLPSLLQTQEGRDRIAHFLEVLSGTSSPALSERFEAIKNEFEVDEILSRLTKEIVEGDEK